MKSIVYNITDQPKCLQPRQGAAAASGGSPHWHLLLPGRKLEAQRGVARVPAVRRRRHGRHPKARQHQMAFPREMRQPDHQSVASPEGILREPQRRREARTSEAMCWQLQQSWHEAHVSLSAVFVDSSQQIQRTLPGRAMSQSDFLWSRLCLTGMYSFGSENVFK